MILIAIPIIIMENTSIYNGLWYWIFWNYTCMVCFQKKRATKKRESTHIIVCVVKGWDSLGAPRTKRGRPGGFEKGWDSLVAP